MNYNNDVCPTASIEKLIPNFIVFGVFSPVSIKFQDGLPITLIEYIMLNINKIVYSNGPRFASDQLDHEIEDVIRTVLINLANKGYLYRDPINPNHWIYERG